MARPAPKMEELWKRLGLDSLEGAGAALDATRTRSWGHEEADDDDETTAPSARALLPTERPDLPRLSLAPPTASDAGRARDLVVTGVLGEGGMGRVLLARQASLDRDVAVKVPLPEASKGAVSALLHEARITGALEHPGVIPVYSLVTDADGQPALMMKRVDGVSWSMLLRHADDAAWERLAPPGVDRLGVHVDILRQVCNAVAFAHKRGVLHRDIKPSNVLIGEFGEVYLADWGVATTRPRPGEVRKPGLVGSPVYLAPEMVTGDDRLMDERTDVFLLGATLYEVLGGNPPWRGLDLRSVLSEALACQPRPLPQGTPAELAALCARAMASAPEDRYATVLELREALSAYLRHRGSVRLAQAASARLAALEAAQDRDAGYGTLAECRFGFRQALEEWPGNDEARQGLVRCTEAAVALEVRLGNLAAARALARELPQLPPALAASMEALEARLAAQAQRTARFERLSRDMDPQVASRQRAVVVVATMAVLFAVVPLIELLPPIKQRMLALGPWYPLATIQPYVLVLALGIWWARRTLLSTRINRRLVGTLAAAGLVSVVVRVIGGLEAVELRQVIWANFAALVGVSLTAGLTLHRGFLRSTALFSAGLVAALALPGLEQLSLTISTTLALGAAMLSWRRWRGDFALPDAP